MRLRTNRIATARQVRLLILWGEIERLTNGIGKVCNDLKEGGDRNTRLGDVYRTVSIVKKGGKGGYATYLEPFRRGDEERLDS
jgi:hypothetical protein